MNCFNHTDDNAVAQCQDCQKGLCTTCSKLYVLPICKYCNDYRISQEKKDIYLNYFIFRCKIKNSNPILLKDLSFFFNNKKNEKF